VQDLRPVQQKEIASAKPLTAPDVGQTLVAQAKALEDAKKPGEAVVMYEKIRASDSTQATFASKRIAFLRLCNNDLDRAEQEYQVLLQKYPRDPDVLCALGDIAYRRGHFGIAEKLFRDALSKRPEHAQALANLGMTLAQTGDFAGSIEAFKKAGFSDAEAYCEVAFVLKVNGKSEQAMAAYQEALNRDPKLERARMEMSQLYRHDPDIVVRMTTPTIPATPAKNGKIGAVETELPPPPAPLEGSGRTMIQRPTLGALPDVEIPVPGVGDWPTPGKKK
jgi:tetratricopeptide (TPR) repeat protein